MAHVDLVLCLIENEKVRLGGPEEAQVSRSSMLDL